MVIEFKRTGWPKAPVAFLSIVEAYGAVQFHDA